MIPLNENIIRSHIDETKINHPLYFHLLDTIHSTNRFLKDLPPTEGIVICCAETQTQGRGRFGRVWHSPFGENIYFSARWRIDEALSCLSGLSLVVSLAVLKTLSEFDIKDNLTIKWPNDILWHKQKLSGCLIELLTTGKTPAEVIIGIGINVNSKLDDPWCSLLNITKKQHDRNHIIGRLIHHLNQYLQQLITNGFVFFLEQWQAVDGLKGHLITVSQPTGILSGIVQGVNNTGQLIIIDTNGTPHNLSSGDTTLSKNKPRT